jgi:hypothetical protein
VNTAEEESTMETFLGVLVFAAFLFVQVKAILAVQAAGERRDSPAYDAIRRDRGAKAIWDSAN